MVSTKKPSQPKLDNAVAKMKHELIEKNEAAIGLAKQKNKWN